MLKYLEYFSFLQIFLSCLLRDLNTWLNLCYIGYLQINSFKIGIMLIAWLTYKQSDH